MSAPVHEVVVMMNFKSEGSLRLLIQQETEPSFNEAFSTPLDTAVLMHGTSCGAMKVVHVSEYMDILCCPCCLLRVALPVGLKTVGDLRKHLCA